MKLLDIINEQSIHNTPEKKFVIKKRKFQLFLNDILVSESGFNIEQPDEWFNQKYISIFNVKTLEKYKRKGLAKYLLECIFNYAKNELNINIVSLIVYKNNSNAINLYLNCGFEIYMEYEDSYSLIKNL